MRDADVQGPSQENGGSQNQPFKLEEYKQILEERRFVMSRYMQAVGLYLALSGFSIKEVIELNNIFFLCACVIALTTLNVAAIWVAGRFKSMAQHALEREGDYVKEYRLHAHHDLFWGYRGGIVLVIVIEATVLTITIYKLGWGAR